VRAGGVADEVEGPRTHEGLVEEILGVAIGRRLAVYAADVTGVQPPAIEPGSRRER
jgi:hypothetical protein